MEGSVDPDAAQPLEPPSGSGEPSTSYSSGSGSSAEQQAGLVQRPKSALRRYVESFDQETMMETARWVAARQACVCGVGWPAGCSLQCGRWSAAGCRCRRPHGDLVALSCRRHPPLQPPQSFPLTNPFSDLPLPRAAGWSRSSRPR